MSSVLPSKPYDDVTTAEESIAYWVTNARSTFLLESYRAADVINTFYAAAGLPTTVTVLVEDNPVLAVRYLVRKVTTQGWQILMPQDILEAVIRNIFKCANEVSSGDVPYVKGTSDNLTLVADKQTRWKREESVIPRAEWKKIQKTEIPLSGTIDRILDKVVEDYLPKMPVTPTGNFQLSTYSFSNTNRLGLLAQLGLLYADNKYDPKCAQLCSLIAAYLDTVTICGLWIPTNKAAILSQRPKYIIGNSKTNITKVEYRQGFSATFYDGADGLSYTVKGQNPKDLDNSNTDIMITLAGQQNIVKRSQQEYQKKYQEIVNPKPLQVSPPTWALTVEEVRQVDFRKATVLVNLKIGRELLEPLEYFARPVIFSEILEKARFPKSSAFLSATVEKMETTQSVLGKEVIYPDYKARPKTAVEVNYTVRVHIGTSPRSTAVSYSSNVDKIDVVDKKEKKGYSRWQNILRLKNRID